MAKQAGLIKVKGTLDNVTFYQTQDGHLVKMKTHIDGKRIAKDPAFARTRENGKEFGMAAKAGKLLRDTLRTMTVNSVRGRIAGKITQLMGQIKNYDLTNARGLRNVGTAISTSEGKNLLRGLEFNSSVLLGNVLLKPYVLDVTTGVISISDLLPANDIAWPQGATHFSLTGGFANIDFKSGSSDLKLTNVLNLAKDAPSTTISLTPTADPNGSGIHLYILKVEFFQSVNGIQYSLKNGAFNALKVIEVV